MAEQEQSPWDIEGEQIITLAPGEGLPGFPGGHGPGVYLVDFKNRTIRPKPVEKPKLVKKTQPVEETATESQPEENQGG